MEPIAIAYIAYVFAFLAIVGLIDTLVTIRGWHQLAEPIMQKMQTSDRWKHGGWKLGVIFIFGTMVFTFLAGSAFTTLMLSCK